MPQATEKERRFLGIIESHRSLLYKICYMYARDGEHFNDLYQEVLANAWQGLDTFRGEASLSTWLYRTAINTCVTYFRKNSRHTEGKVSLDSIVHIAGDAGDNSRIEQLKQMYHLISGLSALDKALILMWLDEKSYEEIADLSGLTRNNVATRLRRIKQKLIEKNNNQ
ncbi:MAG: sigma-70 family RNA polymerase sigma factor [Muribaculaceae bacterium]|nr:sigma-70 family RNA polymerase sigma factor [Muribaculaceae bacterium]